MAGPLYKSLHFSYSNRRTNPNPLRPAQILQRHATVCVSDSVGTEAFKKFYKEEFLMRNLKKVLSLVLCVAMMLSVMVVGAGAAFSDQSKIKNTEAVDACTALNIIGGYPDGSFKPEGNITRAEVTKMICVALNGGKEPNLATNATPTFSDVRTNANSAWAEKYIESCASQGIVSGVGAGKFAPAGNVTGTQLAKMLLVALGYKSENEGFTGNAWATNVNTIASAKGLYAGLETIDPSAAITRDSAAQMVWNAMNAYEVEYKTSLIAGADGKLSTQITVQDKLGLDGKSKITLLEDKYDAIAITGTLTKVQQDKGKSTYSITVKNPKYNGKDYTGADSTTKEISYTDVTKDYSDLLYQNVRVLVKPDSNGKDAVVYGVYGTNKNTTQTGILKNLKMDGAKAKLDGTKYDLASKANQTVYVNGEDVSSTYAAIDNTKGAIQNFIEKYGDGATNKYTEAAYFQPTEVSLIAVDGTTNYSILKVKTVAVGKVTAVGSDYINVTIKKGDTSIATKTKLENDDWNWYSGIAKNDYVILTAAGNYGTNKGLVEKATVVTGKVTGTKSTDGVSVANNWYTMAGKKLKSGSTTDYVPAVDRPNTGANVEMVVVNGYVYYTDTTVGSVDDMALLVEAAPSGGVNSKWEGRLIFSDGSDKVVTIEKKWDDKDDGVAIKEFHEGTGANPNIALSSGGSTTYAAPMLVSYEVSKDVYTLTRIGYKNTDTTDTTIDTNGYDAYVTGSTNLKTDGSIKKISSSGSGLTVGAGNIDRMYYESTGVVFVKYDDKAAKTGATGYAEDESDASYKVVTGKAATTYDRNLSAVTAVANKSGNSYYAQAAFIDLGENSTGTNSDNYAVVLDDVQKRTGTEDGTVYLITAWNGKENITVKTDDSKAADMSKGDIFSYTATGDTLADIDYSSSKQDNYYVNSFDEDSGDISLYTYNEKAEGANKWVATANVDAYTKVDSKDTVVLYVDSDAGKGLTGSLSDISLAYVFDSNYWPNGVLPEMSTITINKKVATGTVDSNSVTMTQDAVPNVRAYVDNASDDQITVLVVDTANNNITKW